MKSVFISARDYDKIKKGEEIELVVEAKDRGPISVWVSYGGSCRSNSDDFSNYENAVFNGEVD